MTKHTIDTGEVTPIKVPPRQIPFHPADQVHAQLQDMAMEGIICPSTSPWCAPAMYVPKRSGEVKICVDFVKLDQVTKKDSYPVPPLDGPQQRLAGKKVFSKVDLRSAYWSRSRLWTLGIHCHPIWVDRSHTNLSASLGPYPEKL